MPITSEYRPANVTASTQLRVQVDDWSAGSPGDIDANGAVWTIEREGVSGWWDAPSPRLSLSTRPGEHGAFDGPAFLESRVVSLKGACHATDRASSRRARDIVASVCGDPSLGLLTLTVTNSGNPTRQAAVRRSAETKTQYRGGGITFDWSIILTAPDPRRYAAALSTQFTGLPTAGAGGLVFPLVFPLVFGTGTSGGELSLVNGGTIAMWPVWTIRGPVTGPAITSLTSGQALVFDPTFVVPAGQDLIIDTDAKTVLLQGVNVRNRLFTASWFRLTPGTTAVRFSAVSGADPAAKLTAVWREAWT